MNPPKKQMSGIIAITQIRTTNTQHTYVLHKFLQLDILISNLFYIFFFCIHLVKCQKIHCRFINSFMPLIYQYNKEA